MRPIFKPLPRSITRPVSILLLVAWIAAMAALVNRSYLQASSATLATDLARYGSAAVWRGVYYRGEKIGFTVSQTVSNDEGFQIEEDGRLQMSLLGATTAATIHTSAQVDAEFALQSFAFSLDPGTGPLEVRGRLDGKKLTLEIKTAAGTRTDVRELAEPPALSLNLARRLANSGLTAGSRHRWTIFDPATLSNAPIELEVGKRELVYNLGRPTPAFRVQMAFAGLKTTSWVTDTGEVIREESPLGLITVRESAESARAMAVSRRLQVDMLQTAAVVPRQMRTRITEPRDVRRMRLRVDGVDLSSGDLRGVNQRVDGNLVELRDPRQLEPEPADSSATAYLAPEPFIESEAPEIRSEAETAVHGATSTRDRAEKLTRYVNALLDKKPTVSLPSAREVLRTRVGDCNEHTALYVAMARAAGIPARIAVGLVFVHGAFYYHAWPEVYIDELPSGSGQARGLWLPVDPTLNQFPADATHLRLARGGLDKQAAILPMIGRLKIDVVDLELAPNSTPILVGKTPIDLGAIAIPIPRRESSCCACRRKD
jgi:transglutaminase-like putative cysteine protease